MTVPEGALSRNFTLLDSELEERLEHTCEKAATIAHEAFEWWVGVLRWVSGDYRLGQPEVSGAESGWGVHLTDRDRGKDFHRSRCIFTAQGGARIGKAEWRKAQKLFDTKRRAPVWINSLFEAEQRFDAGDSYGGVLNLAIAVETIVRNVIARTMDAVPEEFQSEIHKGFRATSLVQRWHKLNIPGPDWRDLKKCDALFARRNDIMHRGETRQPLSESECERLLQIARSVVLAGDDWFCKILGLGRVAKRRR